MKKIFVFGIILLSACSTNQLTRNNKVPDTQLVVNGKMFATLYQQKAAEYRALCFQAFNIAKLRLDTYQAKTNKPRAIITDIDETILDNSPYAAHQALLGKDYEPASWSQWIEKASADTLPGAAAFLKYAASKGVTIFYITNREEKERMNTIKNLRSFNLPNADDAHFLPKQKVSGKEARRLSVFSTHEIMMLLGDNLEDFSILFEKKSTEERLRNTSFSATDFGNRFIIFPNPVYGDWERAIYNYNRITDNQKDSTIRSVLKTY